jgi:hypothetical protein
MDRTDSLTMEGGRPLSMVGLAVKKTAEKAVLVEEVQV